MPGPTPHQAVNETAGLGGHPAAAADRLKALFPAPPIVGMANAYVPIFY